MLHLLCSLLYKLRQHLRKEVYIALFIQLEQCKELCLNSPFISPCWHQREGSPSGPQQS